jgi:hypothetical protein
MLVQGREGWWRAVMEQAKKSIGVQFFLYRRLGY